MPKKNIVALNDDTFNEFIEEMIGKIFKILPLYEDYCIKEDKKEFFYSYVDKVIVLLVGSQLFQESESFVSIASVLNGIDAKKDMTQKEIKSLVFHCISVLNSARRG